MKRVQTIVLLLLLAGVGWQCRTRPAAKPAASETTFFRYTTGKEAAISAHRGGGDYKGYPENCIESFAMLQQQMPVVIECDITLSKDSALVMMHDDDLDRTTTGRGKLRQYSLAELRQFYLKDNLGNTTNYRIPTLDEVLAWGKGKAMFTLDVKRGVPFDRVVEAVVRSGSQATAAIITYNADDAARVHQLDPSLFISVTVRSMEEYERHVAKGIPDSVMVAFVGTRQPNASLCRFLHEKGIRCILGTLGNLDNMAASRGDRMYREWVAAGADILSTDRPLEAWKALR